MAVLDQAFEWVVTSDVRFDALQDWRGSVRDQGIDTFIATHGNITAFAKQWYVLRRVEN